MKKSIFLISLVLLSIQCKTLSGEAPYKERPSIQQSLNPFPAPIGHVSDFDNTLTNEQITTLNKLIADFKKETTNEIAVVSISKNLNRDNFIPYALDLSNEWGIGIPGEDNGLTLVYSKELRMIRISTGKGTEKILTDSICENVLNEQILPEFKKGDYYTGIHQGLIELMTLWKTLPRVA